MAADVMITYQGPYKPPCHISPQFFGTSHQRWLELEHLPFLESLPFYPPTVSALMRMVKV